MEKGRRPHVYDILTVDDERVPRDFISYVAKEHDLPVVVHHAENATSALAVCRRIVPAIAILDIEMPGVDGLTLGEEIRRKYPSIPIVFLTAHDDFSFAQRALRLGAQDYLLKPLTPEACVAVITRYAGDSVRNKSTTRINELVSRDKRLAEAVRIVKNDPKDAPAMPRIAERLGFSKGHFSRSFHHFTGQTYSRYVQTARIERAKALLSTTDYTLSRIAAEVGYNDPSYLSSVFSSVTGVRPSDYREINSPSE